MFEISELKAKTLADLQQIAKSIGLTKTSQLKKLDLVYQILDIQAATPIKEEKRSENPKPRVNKPKRKRVVKKVVSEEIISKDITKPTSEILEKKSNLDSNELVWHRDREDRIVEAIKDTDWLIQLDNELPKKLDKIREKYWLMPIEDFSELTKIKLPINY